MLAIQQRIFFWVLALSHLLGFAIYSHAQESDQSQASSANSSPAADDSIQVDLQNSIHGAPILLKANQLRPVANFPVNSYRLFRTDASGTAIPIPFQIDEMNEWGDYVLNLGAGASYAVGNGIFDQIDEIALMGEDVGAVKVPTKWGFNKPNQLYEIKFRYMGRAVGDDAPKQQIGAVYLGIYFGSASPLSKKWYVKFDLKEAQVVTDRYRYRFNKDNYLVVRGVEVARKNSTGEYDYSPLLDSSTFYLNVDMKFFISMAIGAFDVKSKLEAYKMGPIRTVVRVSFNYELLKLKFDLGMYTEVSFFSNAVFLPAIFYNPLNGPKSLNSGSGFYYGFSLIDNPFRLDIDTNLGQYDTKGSKEDKSKAMAPFYWISAAGKEEFFYLRLIPSQQMRRLGYVPDFYVEEKSSKELGVRNDKSAKPLGKSPVNLAMYFDLTKFDEGEHLMTFQLYFENKHTPSLMNSIKNLHLWNSDIMKVSGY